MRLIDLGLIRSIKSQIDYRFQIVLLDKIEGHKGRKAELSENPFDALSNALEIFLIERQDGHYKECSGIRLNRVCAENFTLTVTQTVNCII